MSDIEKQYAYEHDRNSFRSIAALVRERPNGGDVVIPERIDYAVTVPQPGEVPSYKPPRTTPVAVHLLGMLERAYELNDDIAEDYQQAIRRADEWPALWRGIKFLRKHIAWLERKLRRVERERDRLIAGTLPMRTIYTEAKVFVRGTDIEIRAFGHVFGYRMRREDMQRPGYVDSCWAELGVEMAKYLRQKYEARHATV